MPLSLVENWRNELAKWCPRVWVAVFHSDSKAEVPTPHCALCLPLRAVALVSFMSCQHLLRTPPFDRLSQRKRRLDILRDSGGICLTTYGTMKSQIKGLEKVRADRACLPCLRCLPCLLLLV